MGLKENVIIGKLIPTGTGLKRYQQIKINTENKLKEQLEGIEAENSNE